MNAAILLVSSAWMVGQTPEVIIPVSHNSCGANCGTACCDGPSLRDRIRSLFQRDCCPQPCAQPCPQPRCHEVRCREVRCHNACEPRCHSFHWPQLNFGNRCCKSSCDPCGHRTCHTTCHTTSNDCCGPSLLDRIRGAFRRDCCDAGCHTRCCTTGGAAPAAEPLKEQPKKMPGKTEPKKATETSVITPPAQSPLPAIQNAPVIAPAAAPRIIENDNRNPF